MKYIYEMKYLILTIIIIVIIFAISLNIENIYKGLKTINLKESTNILDTKTYYAEYSVKVYSNKTINTYNITEWYRGKNNQKIEYIDDDMNVITQVLENNELRVKSSSENLEYVLDTSKINLLQNEFNLMDFICMYKDENGKKYKYEEDGEIVYEIILDKSTWYNSEIYRRILRVKKDNKPIYMINLDKNKKVISEIKFEKIGELND